MKRLIPIALACAASLTSFGFAQGAQDEEIENPFAQKDPREEMTRLFHKVERALDSISDALYEAGAGGSGLEELDGSGLHELLKNTGAQSGAAVEDIDRILKLAEEMAQQSQSSSGSSSPPTGESPMDGDSKGGPRQREGTPQGPRPQDGEEGEGGEKPKEEPGGKEGTEPKPGGEKPGADQQNPDGGENREGDPNDPESGDAVQRAKDKDKWGMLPERVRATFQNQGGEELPAQYRDWIDAYYRRLGERR